MSTGKLVVPRLAAAPTQHIDTTVRGVTFISAAAFL
jgi:hypothetical protein